MPLLARPADGAQMAAPAETATPTVTPGPTATVTLPVHVYLPLVMQMELFSQPCSIPPATTRTSGQFAPVALDSTDNVRRPLPVEMAAALRAQMRLRGSDDQAHLLPGQSGTGPGASSFHGRVTAYGVVTSGVTLKLIFFNGSQETEVDSAVTDANGDYTFRLDLPPLAQGQQYYVVYSNEENHSGPAYLWYWQCNPTSVYPTARDLRCDFDLAGISLQSPPNPVMVAVPVTFRWNRRAATLGDTYAFTLWNPRAKLLYISEDLGPTDSYHMLRVPDQFGPNQAYYWAPNVYNTYGGGWGYAAGLVRFDRYFDDFGEVTSGWFTGESSFYSVGYSGGEYRILVKPKNSGGPISRSPSGYAGSYAVDVDVRLTSQSPGAIGVLFGINSDLTEYYSLWVDPIGQQFTVLKLKPNQLWDTLLSWTVSRAIQASTAINHLQVNRKGSSIEICVNGTWLTTLEDASYTGWRRMGVSLSSFDQENVEAHFDNFQVRVLESGPVR